MIRYFKYWYRKFINSCKSNGIVVKAEAKPFYVQSVNDAVTYRYLIGNEGPGDIYDVTITDSSIDPNNPLVIQDITLVSGDVNNDGILRQNEAWEFESKRTWTWANGDVLESEVTVTGKDCRKNILLEDKKTIFVYTIGVG